jgi:hypothetical protein
MKESTTIAYTYSKSFLGRRFPENRFFEKAPIHLHVPEGATPKDGEFSLHTFDCCLEWPRLIVTFRIFRTVCGCHHDDFAPLACLEQARAEGRGHDG